MTPDVSNKPRDEDVERQIRIILWNALKTKGVGECFIYPVINDAAPKLLAAIAAMPPVSNKGVVEAPVEREAVLAEVLDALNEQLEYPTEACAIVRSLASLRSSLRSGG